MDLETLMQYVSCCCFKSRSTKQKKLVSVSPIKADEDYHEVDRSRKERAEDFWEGGKNN